VEYPVTVRYEHGFATFAALRSKLDWGVATSMHGDPHGFVVEWACRGSLPFHGTVFVRPPYDTRESEKTAEAIRQAEGVAQWLFGLLGAEVERMTNTTE
jgi:hypothetical protein